MHVTLTYMFSLVLATACSSLAVCSDTLCFTLYVYVPVLCARSRQHLSWMLCSLLLMSVHAGGLVQIWPSFGVLSLSVLMDSTGLRLSWAHRSMGESYLLSLNRNFFFSLACCFPVIISPLVPKAPAEPGRKRSHRRGLSEIRWTQAVFAFLVINSLKNISQGTAYLWSCVKLWE